MLDYVFTNCIAGQEDNAGKSVFVLPCFLLEPSSVAELGLFDILIRNYIFLTFQLIRQCEPKNVMFVHGENAKMEFLKEKVEKVRHFVCLLFTIGYLLLHLKGIEAIILSL